MRKILLIGELNKIIENLYDCLQRDFDVQICSEHLKSLQGMIRITKPDLIVVNVIGNEKLDSAIFEYLQKECSQKPTLLVTTTEGWKHYGVYCDGPYFEKVYRPISKAELLEKCYEMLGIQRYQMREEEEQRLLSQGPKTILLVDDSPLLLRNITAILKDKYKVYVATSGEQALKMIPQKMPDLIMLDYEMPGMNGKETFKKMKENGNMADIPVVFLTCISDREHIYSVLEMNPAGYILKPPDENNLLKTIEYAIGW